MGTLLVLGVGLLVTWAAVRDVRAAVSPVRLPCSKLLEDPQPGQWVLVEGCRLQFSSASAAWWSHRGTTAPELLVPLAAGPGEAPVRLVLATRDVSLLALGSSLDAAAPDTVDAMLAARATELAPLLTPKTLRGRVSQLEPSRAPTGTQEGLLVLEDDQRERLATLGRLVLGLIIMLVAFWPVARRIQLERELASLSRAGPSEPTLSSRSD